MKRRIFWSILLTSFLLLALTVSVVMAAVYNEFSDERKAEIKTEIGYIVSAYNGEDIAYLQQIGTASQNRISLIAPDGTVLYDSFVDASTLENHSDRPEIIDALKTGTGESTRASATLGQKTYYYAVQLDDGNVLRLAATIKSMASILDNTATVIFIILIFALVIIIITADLLTKRIVAPINRIDPEDPLSSDAYEEFSPLIVSIDKRNKKIEEQIRALSEKQREFSEVTDGMSEALVIFGSERKVLSANRSAKRVFSSYEPVGLGYLEFCRDLAYIHVVEEAFLGRPAQEKFERDGKIYRLSADPVGESNEFAAVLFVTDITDAERAEQMRREFSANVSHELKTPLTSILGYAEIMRNGVAKPEDFPRFTGQIYDEASRLLSLIEDIIKLSKLDEGGLKQEFRKTDLYPVCENVISKLTRKAKSADVSLNLQGEHLAVNGIENTLYEMIYNLCDNAIIYNKRGGSVTVGLNLEDGHPVLSVKDTGIGIAPEHQSRVFERFYRIDKSHSKATGGTGLGLSIVKHGAMLHGAQVKLNSMPGQGTEIDIIFP